MRVEIIASVDALVTAGVMHNDVRAVVGPTKRLWGLLAAHTAIPENARSAIRDLNAAALNVRGPVDWERGTPGLAQLVTAEEALYAALGMPVPDDAGWMTAVEKQEEKSV